MFRQTLKIALQKRQSALDRLRAQIHGGESGHPRKTLRQMVASRKRRIRTSYHGDGRGGGGSGNRERHQEA